MDGIVSVVHNSTRFLCHLIRQTVEHIRAHYPSTHWTFGSTTKVKKLNKYISINGQMKKCWAPMFEIIERTKQQKKTPKKNPNKHQYIQKRVDEENEHA